MTLIKAMHRLQVHVYVLESNYVGKAINHTATHQIASSEKINLPQKMLMKQ